MAKVDYKGFPPVYDKNSEILILGSFPSVISRKDGFYYANKQNRFWKTLSKIFNEEIGDDIKTKTDFLLKHNLALSDVFSSSNLKGSMDTDLLKSSNKINNINSLLPPHTKVRKILCNGKAAYTTLMSNYNLDIKVIYLPSTSGANPRFNYEIWKEELIKN